MKVLTFLRTVFTTKSIIAVTMRYTTFDITNEKMFKMTKGNNWIGKILTRCDSLRLFSASVVCAKHRASWPFCKQTMASWLWWPRSSTQNPD